MNNKIIIKTTVKTTPDTPDMSKKPLSEGIQNIYNFFKNVVLMIYRLLVFLYKKGPLS